MIALLFLATAVAEPVTCRFGEAPPAPCTMRIEPLPDGRDRIRFTAGRRAMMFVGRRQDGWWSGTLGGRPAMGWERNRGHVVFSTADLASRFAWWSRGSEHGNY